MPTDARIDKKADMIRIVLTGAVKTPEILQELTDLFNHPLFRKSMNALVDLRKMHNLTSSRAVRTMANFIGRHKDKVGSARVAIVVSTLVTLGLTNMFIALTRQTSLTLAVFRNDQQALNWLDLNDEPEKLLTHPADDSGI